MNNDINKKQTVITNPAPIILFVYNRPWHTQQTIEALQKNELADQSNLIIYSDAPKNDQASSQVQEVRDYLKTVSGFKSVKIIVRDNNWGLAANIIDGVTEVVNQYGRIVVLEDDMVTSPFFLKYMNDALNVYQNDAKVMHVSGYMFPAQTADLPETFFLRTASCWGWATWGRAWSFFNKDPDSLIRNLPKKEIKSFNMDDAYNFWAQVQQNASGEINTWAIFWYATIFNAGGICLHPAVSMVNNIGHDGTGEHCKSGDDFLVSLAGKPVAYFEREIRESELAHARAKKFFLKTRLSIVARVRRLLSVDERVDRLKMIFTKRRG